MAGEAEPFERARRLYDLACFNDDQGALAAADRVLDGAAARPMLERARELAAAAGDHLTLSYAVRHLGFAEMARGHLDAARRLLEESVALRRDIGFMPGVAAGILALADLAACRGDHDQAASLLDEAAAIAADAGAAGVLRWVDQAREEI